MPNDKIEAKKPAKVLFNSLAYNSDDEYITSLKNMKPDAAVVSLVAAAAKAQLAGVYTFEESEVIINAIRVLTKGGRDKNDDTQK